MAALAEELIENNIKAVLLDGINHLYHLLDYSCIRWNGCALWFLRLGGMFEETLLPNLLQARRLISLIMIDNSFDLYNNDRAVIAMIED